MLPNYKRKQNQNRGFTIIVRRLPKSFKRSTTTIAHHKKKNQKEADETVSFKSYLAPDRKRESGFKDGKNETKE